MENQRTNGPNEPWEGTVAQQLTNSNQQTDSDQDHLRVNGSWPDGVVSDRIHFLHFNDVYNIEASTAADPCGGAARFVSLLHSLRSSGVGVGKNNGHVSIPKEDPAPVVLFSGDAFNPSLMSTVTKGVQMVPVLNAMDVEVAVYGNHDFDFGVDVLEDLASKNNFPWLMSNVDDNYTGLPLANGKVTHTTTIGGRCVGFVGLVEDAWIQTLATVDEEQVTYKDFVEEGRRLARELRASGAEVVIALTHMRWPNDRRLAQNVDEIDIVLGGHDHDYGMEKVKGTRNGEEVDKVILKSGTDFRELSTVSLHFEADGIRFDVQKLTVDSSIDEDLETKAVVDHFGADLHKKMEEVLGVMDVQLDGRFASVRTMETNLGNFVCDIMLAATDAELAILNSGTLRSDTLHPPGNFTRGHLTTVLPYVDPIVVLRCSAHDVLQALENAVCKYPTHEGRFAQVAGVRFAFDPSLPPGSRVNPRFVQIQDNYLDMEKTDYRLATKAYLAMGKDGYDVFADCEVLVDEETGPILRVCVENHFESVKILRGEKSQKRSKHRQPLLSRRSASLRSSLPPDTTPLDHVDSGEDIANAPSKRSRESVHRTKSLGGGNAMKKRLVKQKTVEELEKEKYGCSANDTDDQLAHLSPSTDGRIVVIDGPEVIEYLEDLRTIWEVKNNPTPLSDLTELDDDEGGWGDEHAAAGDPVVAA